MDGIAVAVAALLALELVWVGGAVWVTEAVATSGCSPDVSARPLSTGGGVGCTGRDSGGGIVDCRGCAGGDSWLVCVARWNNFVSALSVPTLPRSERACSFA